jgi:uncharacterized 2Fe-2S/4Fe-4S cluster protein (DUF4445 family)
MGSFKVTFQPEGRTVEARTGEKLLEAARRADVGINNLCGGQGVCGKCRVRIVSGKANLSGKQIGVMGSKEMRDRLAWISTEVKSANMGSMKD